MKTPRIAQAVQLAALVLALALVPVALAAKGGNGKGADPSSINLVMVNDLTGNGSPSWGDTVTFDVSSTATSSPYVNLSCDQGGTLVVSGDGFFGSGGWGQYMTLRSTLWSSGAADCTANAYYFDGKKTVTFATLPFDVDA